MTLTPLFHTGYEHGFNGTAANMALGGGLATAVAATPTVTAGAARTGSYGLHIPHAANAAWWVHHAFTANAKVVLRVAVKFSLLPTGSDMAYFLQVTGLDNVGLNIRGDGVCLLDIGGGTQQSCAGVGDGSWHVIELQIDASATTWTCDWKVDGVAQTRATFAEGATGTLNTVELGTHATNSDAYTCDYDDLIVGAWTVAGTDWWGDGGSIAQPAASDGTHVTVGNFRPGDAGTAYSGTVTTAYTMVDDAPATGAWTTTRSTTDSIGMGTNASTAYMEIAPATTAKTGTANAVRALLSYSSSSTSANLAGTGVVNSGGTQTDIWGTRGGTGASYAAPATGANGFKGAIVAKPVAGWTATEVNALRWRFGGCTSGDVSPVPTVQGLMLEVDWPVATATSLNAPSAAATGAGVVPTSNDASSAPQAAATGAASVPTSSVSATVPTAAATGAAVAPTVTITNVQAYPSAANAPAAASAPTSSTDHTVPQAAATGAALAPTSSVGSSVPQAAGTGSAPAPTTSVSSSAPTAAVTGAALAPSTSVAASAPTASATGAAVAPTISLVRDVSVPAATATGAGVAPSSQASSSPPAAQATGAAPASTASEEETEAVAHATGAAVPPTTSVSVDVGAATATGAAIPPSASVSIDVLPAGATATSAAASTSVTSSPISYGLVGTAGTAQASASGADLTTLAWGAGEDRRDGNLLACFVDGQGSAALPAAPSGWLVAAQQAGTNCSTSIFYRYATGGDAAPVIAGVPGAILQGSLAEFSGSTPTPLDQAGGAAGSSSPIVATAGSADATIGELLLYAGAANYSSAATATMTPAPTNTNGRFTNLQQNAVTSTTNHYQFGYAITTVKTTPDSDSWTITTTNLNGAALAIATFKLRINAAQATAAAPAPTVTYAVSIDVSAAQATAVAIPPTTSVSIDVSAAAATATAWPPALGGVKGLDAPAAVATGSAPAPTTDTGAYVPSAAVIASAPPPTISGIEDVAVPAANATASAPAPDSSSSVGAPSANASAAAPPPTISTTGEPLSIDVGAAQATVSATAPSPAVTSTAPAAPATGAASAPAQAVSSSVPGARVSAAAVPPTVERVVSLDVPAASATGASYAAETSYSADLPPAEASASARASTSVVATVPAAPALGAAWPPSISSEHVNVAGPPIPAGSIVFAEPGGLTILAGTPGRQVVGGEGSITGPQVGVLITADN